jgi:hypothetical protein
LNFAPGPDNGGPFSIFQEDGASTDVTDRWVSSKALITAGKGSRTSPEKEKPFEVSRVNQQTGRGGPKIASTIWSVSLRAEGKSSVNGTERFLSCVVRRCGEDQHISHLPQRGGETEPLT